MKNSNFTSTNNSYSDLLKKPEWQKRRLQIFERDKWACVKCKDTKNELQVHHLKYTGKPWQAPDADLETLCCHCHFIISKYKIHIEKAVKTLTEKTENVAVRFKSGESLYLFIFNDNMGVETSLEFTEMSLLEMLNLLKS